MDKLFIYQHGTGINIEGAVTIESANRSTMELRVKDKHTGKNKRIFPGMNDCIVITYDEGE